MIEEKIMIYHIYENRKTYCKAQEREEMPMHKRRRKEENQYVKCINADHAY